MNDIGLLWVVVAAALVGVCCWYALVFRPGTERRKARGALKRAEHVYEQGIREAKKALERAHKAYDKRVSALNKELQVLESKEGRVIKRSHGVTLYERWINTPSGSGPLAGTEASVETSSSIHKHHTGLRTAASLTVLGPAGLLVNPRKKFVEDDNFLVITSPSVACVVKYDPKQGAKARQFAAEINSAAMRSVALEERRPEATRKLKEDLSRATADTAEIEASNQALAVAQQHPERLGAVEAARREVMRLGAGRRRASGS